ncbi:MAG: ATP-binding protein [Peptococcaceae bacterium]|jgi:hypothetical protein|nr:ATP-binding protein [Peptococcaceae bacterium]
MKKLPLGIQNLKEIIRDGYVYVDKTQFIFELINEAKSCFLSRPRRFGKSLLLDTISEVFGGDKELFKGLWIYESGYDFVRYPVLRLDMSNIANESPGILKSELSNELKRRANRECFDIEYSSPSAAFKTIIEELYYKHNQRVVVLIDEYDKPILDHIQNIEIAEANREVLRAFYGVLKSMDPYLRLTFVTGVTKFTKTSIFSGLNNLLDITMMEKYANICGIPVEDLDRYFHEHIEELKTRNSFKRFENLHNEILAWYDGYSWDGVSRVINPFGLLTFFLQGRFSSFWYASGSPKFLLDIIKMKPEIYANFKDVKLGEWEMDIFDVKNIQIAPLLFQTGYLTVKEVLYDLGSVAYRLDIPNHEVREVFSLHLLAELTEQDNAVAGSAYRNMKEALQAGDLQRVRDILKSLFSSIPYQLHVNNEAYYHSIFYAIMNLLGFTVFAEVSVSMGRIDAVLELADLIYILEFKYKNCPVDAAPEEKQRLFEEALHEGVKQIEEKGYSDKYAGSGKEIIRAAFAFLGRDDIEMRRLM